MTEIGRRTAILVGTGAFAISVLAGVLYGGDLMMASIKGLAAGVVFGAGGLLIGNLIEGYILQAARREAAQRALERELAREMAAKAAEEAASESVEQAGGASE